MRFLLVFCLILLELGSYLLFCKGFFPTKVLLTPEELSKYKTDPPTSYREPSAKFDRVVFMLVDAMRSDFVFSNNSQMAFTQKLLDDGYGLGFTAFSHPPTVTLPRLKGITTGSIPNFIDAVLNIAEDDTSSTLGDQDSWVKQMATNGWQINMFGDDTWLKLFPDYFAKTDGTSSFYVSDFTIVDQNVTRHLDEELSKKGRAQWNTMILHYLGLDHIGHKGGPESANMPAKQRELDVVVEQIFHGLLQKDDKTLMVLMGDHGMNDIGNHGGSSVGETSSAMVLLSSQFKRYGLAKGQVKLPLPYTADFDYLAAVDQIDLVPTLSELIGLQVPINSLGAFIPAFLPLYKDKQSLLIKNALQLKVLLDKSQGTVGSKLEDFCDVKSVDSLFEYINMAKHTLSEASSDYNYDDLHLGIVLSAIFAFESLILYFVHYWHSLVPAAVNLAFFVLYGCSFFSSSSIEEEHHTWWFFATLIAAYTVLLSFRFRRSTIYMFVFLVSLRLLKAWNNSGQKYNLKEYTKISTWILSLPATEGPNVYCGLLAFTFVPYLFGKFRDNLADQSATGFIEFMFVSTMSFNLVTVKLLAYFTSVYDLTSDLGLLPGWSVFFIKWLQSYSGKSDFIAINNDLYRLFHIVWLISAIYVFLQPAVSNLLGKSSGSSYTVNVLVLASYLCISQTHFVNVPLFAVLYGILTGFRALLPTTITRFDLSNYLCIFTIVMQNLSFFQFGETNSLASVDLTNAFNGLSSYNMVLSGILTFISNWAAPIFWSVAYLKLCIDALPSKSDKWNVLYDRLLFNLVFYSVAGLCLVGSCYNLRFHLFIWTVFSPKLLYFLAWLTSNLLVDTLLGAFIVVCYQ